MADSTLIEVALKAKPFSKLMIIIIFRVRDPHSRRMFNILTFRGNAFRGTPEFGCSWETFALADRPIGPSHPAAFVEVAGGIAKA